MNWNKHKKLLQIVAVSFAFIVLIPISISYAGIITADEHTYVGRGSFLDKLWFGYWSWNLIFVGTGMYYFVFLNIIMTIWTDGKW